MAVSGTGVALATAGGVLLYAGLKGQSPLAALKQIVTSGPSALPATGTAPSTSAGTTGPAATGLVAACMVNAADKYSQARRWQQGYSDCSSWVGKGFKNLGITPPGASVTGDYLLWGALSKVDASQAQAGDLLVNAAHMAVVTGPGQAVGQENPSRNVAQGSFADIMAGTGSYLVLRYGSLGSVAGNQYTSTTGYTY